MSLEMSQERGILPHSPSGVESMTVPQLLHEVSTYLVEVTEQPQDHRTAVATILKMGESVAPGEVVRRNRFAGGPPSPVDVISSNLADFDVKDDGVKAVFIEYQLAEPDDITRVIFDNTFKAQQKRGQVDGNMRFRMPRESLRRTYERLYSRKNNNPVWSGRSERVAAREISWNFDDELGGFITEKYLGDRAVDDAIKNYKRLSNNPQRQADLAAKRYMYTPAGQEAQAAVA